MEPDSRNIVISIIIIALFVLGFYLVSIWKGEAFAQSSMNDYFPRDDPLIEEKGKMMMDDVAQLKEKNPD